MGKILNFILILLTISSFGQSREKILQKHFEAHNQEYWDQIQTAQFTGVWLAKDGDANRYYIKYSAKKEGKRAFQWESKKKETCKISFDGKIGWKQIKQKPKLLDDKEVILPQNSFFFGSPVKENPNLKYEGVISWDDIGCHLFIEQRTNDKIEYLIDKNDYLLRRMAIIPDDGGLDNQVIVKFEHYRNYTMIKIPGSIHIKSNLYDDGITINEITLGNGIPDGYFKLVEK